MSWPEPGWYKTTAEAAPTYWDGQAWRSMAPPIAAPEQAQRRKGHPVLWGILGGLFAVVLILVIIFAAIGHGASKLSRNLANNDNLAGPAPAASYKIGDTAKTGGFRVTVFGAKIPQPPVDEFATPSAGNEFVSVDVQIGNPGSSQQSFSSLFGFHLVDGANRQYDRTFFPGLTPDAPDGEIAAGQAIRGFVVFEVPTTSTGLKLRVQGSPTAAGAVFALG